MFVQAPHIDHAATSSLLWVCNLQILYGTLKRLSHIRSSCLYWTIQMCSNLLFVQVSHTEPDHSFLVPAVLDLYPEATVVASKVAINFLKGLTNRCE